MKSFLDKWKNFIDLKKFSDFIFYQDKQEEPSKENPIPNEEQPVEKPTPEAEPDDAPLPPDCLFKFC